MPKKLIKYSAFADVVCDECRSCQKRQEGCHSSCESYQKGSLAIELLRIGLIKERATEGAVNTYFIEKNIAKAKSKHPTTRYGNARKKR